VLDEITQALGLDPLEMRLKNSAKAGDKAIYGPTFGEVSFKETVEAIRLFGAIQGYEPQKGPEANTKGYLTR
jgi:CO/xanthine dehydrogenase Mo-binding subunit